ncbi:PTS system beta-glucoside-specific EIIBCA component [compost metagenome]
MEILIHIGINTVQLKGTHFTSYISEGDSIKKGDRLVEFDIDAIMAAGYDITTSVIVANTPEFTSIEPVQYSKICQGDLYLKVK